MDDDLPIVAPPSLPTAADHPDTPALPVHYDKEPIQVIRDVRQPLPRSQNPAYRHINNQESAGSKITKRSYLNRLALMLGAPEIEKRTYLDPNTGKEDRRQLHPDQLFPFDYVRWEQLSVNVMEDLLAELRDHKEKPVSAATRNSYRALMRGVATEAYKMKLMDVDVLERIKTVKSARYHRLPGGKAQPDRIIRAMLDVCDKVDDAIHARDGLMLTLLVTSGLRRAELVGIQLKNINHETHEFSVTGKGNKERALMMPDVIWERYIDYLARYRGDRPGFLFTAIWNKRNEPSLGKGLSVATVNQRIESIRRRASGLLGVAIAPHDLRRTFATDMFNNGMTIREIQILLGHASAATTETYLFDESAEYRQKSADLNAGRFKKRAIEKQ
ncbi:tyrosine-type recombinase/integrase [Vreelandella rituensis]|uniref:Tyr recombinase domain-containing protein n=1 Tax=Vreelandella rituensis TaxID=2282306 RepID=A0A368U0E7_9GAMM|nr:hypothetical protein DU506_12200 [Halomonas rituensis]